MSLFIEFVVAGEVAFAGDLLLFSNCADCSVVRFRNAAVPPGHDGWH
ncbi:hypothetical protein SynA1825c_02850 [Synechococcus sp. A18-25c]|nr:hypothetical protein SynA1825c_02850 [Synechococcus sp. A18-25c]